MKRKIALGMILTIICVVGTISTSADIPSEEILPQAVVCSPTCGPYTLSCSDVEVSSDAKHSVDWGGYNKTCEYTSYQAYTIYTCTKCGNRTASGMHSHGAEGHESSICGAGNMRVCFLDGTDYDSEIIVEYIE